MRDASTKERIRSQALMLFARDGYEAVSVEQIAQAVGIKAPSLYKHYKSKRDIFEAILERMSEADAEYAREYGMPETAFEENAKAYFSARAEQIMVYTLAAFAHWTTDEFAANFRRLLTLEQYRDAEMGELYQQYLAGGPLSYMQDIFAAMIGDEAQSRQLALSFYAPIFLLYSVYDASSDKESVIELAREHTKRFCARLSEMTK